MLATQLRYTLSVLALLSCSEPPVSTQATLGGFHVRVEARPPRIVVKRGETVLFDVDQVRVRRAAATYEMLFGSFLIEEQPAESWREVSELGEIVVDGAGIGFSLGELGKGRIAAVGDGELTITITAAGDANRVALATSCELGEHFLGFGGQSFDVDHRGQTVPLWVEEDGISKMADDSSGVWFLLGRRHSTHTPMPLYLSSRGYALLLESDARAIFALCSDDSERARVEAWEKEVRLVLFAGEGPKGTLERLTARLGRPQRPPAFAFAPWLDALFGSANVRRVAAKLRAEDVPASVIWTEDFRGGNDESTDYVLEEDWEIDRELYPDFEAVASDLHTLGFKFLTYYNTFLTTSAPVFAEAEAKGVAIQDANGAPYRFTGVKFEDSSMVDLSASAGRDFTREKMRESLRAGADGWMADFSEWLPVDAILASGEDGALAHNRYPVEWARLNQELLTEQTAQDGVERLFFLRAAWLGSQPLVSVVWAGDQQTDFSLGDGMPSVIPMGIGLGVAGFPYFGHDIGGYMSNMTVPTTRELWFRWVSLGALSPVMRTHHGRSARENWSWESDPESTAHFRRWAKLHIRLFPYLYAMAEEGAARGLPIMRAVALEHPAWEPGWTLVDEFLLGDRLLVAPIVSDQARSRVVRLPPGDWYPLGGGARVSGDPEVDAPLEEIPAFVPAGTILVLLPESVDTLAAADSESGVVDLSVAGDDRELWLWPGGASALAEVSGLSYTWDGARLMGPVVGAAWNGAPVTLPIDVVGPGTLVVNGGDGTLVVTGGDPARRLRVRFP